MRASASSRLSFGQGILDFEEECFWPDRSNSSVTHVSYVVCVRWLPIPDMFWCHVDHLTSKSSRRPSDKLSRAENYTTFQSRTSLHHGTVCFGIWCCYTWASSQSVCSVSQCVSVFLGSFVPLLLRLIAFLPSLQI